MQAKETQRKTINRPQMPAAQASNNHALNGQNELPQPQFEIVLNERAGWHSPVQRKATARFIQRKESLSSTPVQNGAASRIESRKGSGAPLPWETRSFMEGRFGADFSDVRIHKDSEAQELSSGLQARAFTVGNEIYFNSGKFSPETTEGSRLLAHELTHTLQQGASSAHIQRDMFDHEDKVHEGLVESYRRHRGYDPDGMDGGPSASAIKYRHNLPATSPLTPDQVDSRIERFAILDAGNSTVLSAHYVVKALATRSANPELDGVFTTIKAEVATLDFDSQMSAIEMSPRRIIPILEQQFVSDPTTSSLDLLSADPSRYRTFAWDKADFPGGPAGPNEGRAVAMHNALSELRPERRANSGKDAVVSRTQFDNSAALQRYLVSQLRSIPDFDPLEDGTQPAKQAKGHSLNRHAQESFIAMRNAAQAEGVYLIIGSSYRTPETAAANAAAADNPNAVASFSSHTLGLAFDLNLSYTDRDSKKHTYTEMTTKPMQNVVDMRESAAHKWMFIHGTEYGFYPFQQEPWHWEYNPPGFPDDFMEEFKNRDAPPPAVTTDKIENP